MRFSTIVLPSVLAASSYGLNIEKRQLPGVPLSALGPITAAMGIGGKVPKGAGTTAREVQEVPAQSNQQYGARRVKIRYGPYQVPGAKRGAIGKMMDGEGGMAWNMPDRNVKKPCVDCLITYMKGGLETPAGEDVNSDVGLWLHHMVAINKGAGLKDATCGHNPLSLPHIDVGASGKNSERFFASGNERTPIDVKNARGDTGYHVKSGDQFSFIIELMNMNPDHKNVYMTMTWEYIPKVPPGFMNAKPVWLDAFQCGLSDVKPKSETAPFTWSSKTWKSNFNGVILGMGSHLHDGGVAIDIFKNNKLLCRSEARYGETPKYVSGMEMGKGKGMKMTGGSGQVKHISSQSSCYNKETDLGNLRVGDRLDMSGYYDYSKHAGMPKNNGKQSDVMVIGIMYVAVPMGQR